MVPRGGGCSLDLHINLGISRVLDFLRFQERDVCRSRLDR